MMKEYLEIHPRVLKAAAQKGKGKKDGKEGRERMNIKQGERVGEVNEFYSLYSH